MSDEQTTTETTTTTTDAGSDAAALAAAREAMGVPDEAAPAAAAPPAPTPVPAAEPTELEKLRAEIRAKEQEQKQREKLGQEYESKFEARVAAERAKLVAEAKAQVQAELRERMKLAPADAISELGVDGVDLVRTLAERAGPNGHALAEIAKLRAELEAVKTGGTKELRAELDALKAEREQAARSQREAAVAAQNRGFVDLVTKDTPAVMHYYGGEQGLLARAQAVATEYCQAKGVEVCPYPVIVQELEAEARKGAADRVKALKAQHDELSKLLQQPAGIAVAPTESNGRKASLPRTLSAQGASERRATPKAAAEMTAAELDEAARAAAREAMGPKKATRMA